MYDLDQEATGCVNELFYRGGPHPKDVRMQDVEYALETIKRCLKEAYAAGVAVGNKERER